MTYSDRFIPSRAATPLDSFLLIDHTLGGIHRGGGSGGAGASARAAGQEPREDAAAAYSQLLRSELLGEGASGGQHGAPPATPTKPRARGALREACTPPGSAKKLFRFQSSPVPAGTPGALSPFATPGAALPPRRAPRKIARSPFKVLDAPSLQDDFYLNLVDWSSHNVLAVGLGTCVYLWSACTSKVTKLCDLSPDDTVCSVNWTQRGADLAVGTSSGDVQIWDALHCKRKRIMRGHRMRVGTLAWSSGVLSSGSRDRSILHRDTRVPNDYVARLSGHKSEVCGLKWSHDDRELASGGNDNQLYIWNHHSTSPALRFSEHTAAVKAIAWSPHTHGLLASGGGTADRCIRFWSTTSAQPLSCVDTGSQVCNLVWSKNVNELVSTHGYSQNQVIVWRYPTMSKLATLTGHTLRVLYLAISPDGQTIVTGAGDETLRFWNVFPSAARSGAVNDANTWGAGHTSIR